VLFQVQEVLTYVDDAKCSVYLSTCKTWKCGSSKGTFHWTEELLTMKLLTCLEIHLCQLAAYWKTFWTCVILPPDYASPSKWEADGDCCMLSSGQFPGVWIIQGVSQLEDITAGGDFLGLCDQKSSYKHVSDFGRLRSYDHLKLRIEGNNYWQ
jgi:hypothetical protein